MAFILYGGPAKGRYSEFNIPKRSGGNRDIHAPDERLKGLQQAPARVLLECEQEIAEKRGFVDGYSHGFEKSRSIFTNAWAHKRPRYVLNFDLANFYPSIDFGRVQGFFIKNKHYALQPKVATIIAQIACFQKALPQGAPSSPIIANLIAHILDIRLGRLARCLR